MRGAASTATPEAARRIVEAERAGGRRVVSVGFMRGFDPGYVDLKARLDAGAIGRGRCSCTARTATPFVHGVLRQRDDHHRQRRP